MVNMGKKLAALLLAALMLLGLTGCGAFETKMARAVQKISKADSLRLEVLDELSVDVTAAGKTVTVPLTLSGTVQLYLGPLKARAELTLEGPAGQTELLYYIEESGDAFNIYQNINGGTAWQKMGLTAGREIRANGLKYIVEGAETFERVEEAGADEGFFRYDGEVPGEFIQGFLELYEVREQLEEEYGLTLDETLFQDLSSIPTTLWLNNRGELDLILLEPGALVDGLLGKLLTDPLAASGLNGLDLSLRVTDNRIVIQMGDYNQLESMEIPQEARRAAGDEMEPWE